MLFTCGRGSLGTTWEWLGLAAQVERAEPCRGAPGSRTGQISPVRLLESKADHGASGFLVPKSAAQRFFQASKATGIWAEKPAHLAKATIAWSAPWQPGPIHSGGGKGLLFQLSAVGLERGF